jgi:hypothetical protein
MGLDGRELFVFLCAVDSGCGAQNLRIKFKPFILRKTDLLR